MVNLNEAYVPERGQGKGHRTEPRPEVRDELVGISADEHGDPDPLNGFDDVEAIDGVSQTDAVTPASRDPRAKRSAALEQPEGDGVDAFDGNADPDGKAMPAAPQHAVLKHPTDYVDPEQGDGAIAGIWVNSRALRIPKGPTEGRNPSSRLRRNPIDGLDSTPDDSPSQRNTPAPNSALDVPEPEAEPRDTEGEVFTFEELEDQDEVGAPNDPEVKKRTRKGK